MEITAKTSKADRVVTVNYEMPESVEALSEKFGADVIASKAIAAITIDLQALIRRSLEGGKTDAEIQQMVNDWKPGERISIAKDPMAAALAVFKTKTPEEQEAFLAELRAKLGA